MKKTKLLPLVLATAFALTGCAGRNTDPLPPELTQNNSSEDTSQNYTPKPPKAIDSVEVTAYKSFLEKYIDENGYTFRVALIKLDEDDQYELAVIKDEGPRKNVYLYSYKDGEVVNLETEGNPFYGTDTDFYYMHKKSTFYYEYLGNSPDYAEMNEVIFYVNKGVPVADQHVCVRTDYETEVKSYFINEREVTEKEYKDFCDAYTMDEEEFGIGDFTRLYSEYTTEIDEKSDLDAALSRDYNSIYNERLYPILDEVKKPVIYFYPEEDGTEVTADLEINGYYTELIPDFNRPEGWTVTADRNGDLHIGNETYEYLFWEAMLKADFTFDEGFCVPGSETETFLDWALTESGLSEKEKQEFIEYWLPEMSQNEYNVISFQTTAYTEQAKLKVNPEPDTMIRVFMAFYGSDEYIEIAPQTLTAPERIGFTVVEWGGSNIG